MTNYEKKILQALQEIEKTVKKLDDTLDKMENTDSKVKHFIEQERAIHEIKKIAREFHKIEKLAEKDAVEQAHRITAEAEQEKALVKIAMATEKLDTELANIGDDDEKVKSFIAQKELADQIKKILQLQPL